MWKGIPRLSGVVKSGGNGPSSSISTTKNSTAATSTKTIVTNIQNDHNGETNPLLAITKPQTTGPQTTGLTGVVSTGHQPNQHLLIQQVLRQRHQQQQQNQQQQSLPFPVYGGYTAYAYTQKGLNGKEIPALYIVSRGIAHDFKEKRGANSRSQQYDSYSSYSEQYQQSEGARQYFNDRFFRKVLQHNIMGIGTTMAIFSVVGIGHAFRNKVWGAGDMISHYDFGRMCVVSSAPSSALDSPYNLVRSWGFSPSVLQIVTHAPKPFIVYDGQPPKRSSSSSDISSSSSSAKSMASTTTSSMNPTTDEFFGHHHHYHHPSHLRSVLLDTDHRFHPNPATSSSIGRGIVPNLCSSPDLLWPEELDRPYLSRPTFDHIFPGQQNHKIVVSDDQASTLVQLATDHLSSAECLIPTEKTDSTGIAAQKTGGEKTAAESASQSGGGNLTPEEEALLAETKRVVQLKEDFLAAQYDLRSLSHEAEATVINQIGVDLMRDRLWTEAMENFRRASGMGSTEATYNLALCYKNGQGARRQPATAMRLWREAAEQGHAGAAYNYGVALLKGYGGVYTLKQHEQAKEWIQRAAKAGLKQACTYMGVNEFKQGRMADSHTYLSNGTGSLASALLTELNSTTTGSQQQQPPPPLLRPSETSGIGDMFFRPTSTSSSSSSLSSIINFRHSSSSSLSNPFMGQKEEIDADDDDDDGGIFFTAGADKNNSNKSSASPAAASTLSKPTLNPLHFTDPGADFGSTISILSASSSSNNSVVSFRK